MSGATTDMASLDEGMLVTGSTHTSSLAPNTTSTGVGMEGAGSVTGLPGKAHEVCILCPESGSGSRTGDASTLLRRYCCTGVRPYCVWHVRSFYSRSAHVMTILGQAGTAGVWAPHKQD